MSLEELQKMLSDFTSSEGDLIARVKEESEKLATICHKLDDAWSGFPMGHNSYYYYEGFSVPPPNSLWSKEWGTVHGVPRGWRYYQGDEIKQEIETFIGNGFTVSEFSKRYEKLLSSAEALKREILIETSDYDFTEKMVSEKEILSFISDFNFGDINQLRADYINGSRAMGQYASRDSDAMMAGRVIPAHITTMAGAHAANEVVDNVEKFIQLVDRFIKQMSKKINTPAESQSVTDRADDFSHIHPVIKEKCFSLYQSTEYAEAVEKSFKVVRDKLRELTGHETGSEAFGKGKLHIKGAAAPNVDSDFNQAVKFLTMSIDMFRNEKSHTSDAKINDPIRAYQYLAMSSLALSLLENSEIVP